MSIRVTCASCKTRFNVSDNFAGKSGPCPKCKAIIKIPDKTEEVVVHGGETFGPKDSTGRPTLKPIFREETKVSAVQLVLLFGAIFLGLAVAVAVRFATDEVPAPLIWIAALVLAPPLSWAGYSFVRNQELDGYHGMELWGRVIGTSLVFALLWIVFPAVLYAINGDEYSMGLSGGILAVIIVAGGAVSMVAYDLEYFMGCVHYGLYVLICLILRFVAGLDFIPLN